MPSLSIDLWLQDHLLFFIRRFVQTGIDARLDLSPRESSWVVVCSAEPTMDPQEGYDGRNPNGVLELLTYPRGTQTAETAYVHCSVARALRLYTLYGDAIPDVFPQEELDAMWPACNKTLQEWSVLRERASVAGVKRRAR